MKRLIVAATLLAAAVGQGCGAGSEPSARSGPAPRAVPLAHPVVHRVLTVRRAGRLPAPVQLPAVVALASGGVQVMGGLDAADSSVDAIVQVDGHSARQVGTLPSALHDAGATRVGGKVFFFGGGTAANTTSDAVLEVSPGGSARQAATLPVTASDVEAATVGSTAYVIGGYTGTTPLTSIVAYRPGQAPKVVAHMPRPLRYAAVATVGNAVLIAGGTSGTSAQRDILRFDPATGRVRTIGSLPNPTTHAAGVALDGRFYVVGGRGDDLSSQRSTILSVDPSNGKVRHAGRLPTALSDLGGATVGSHAVVVGGKDAQGQVHDQVLKLAIRTHTSTHKAHASASSAHVAGLLNSRDVYAADRPGMLSAQVRNDPARVYVPNSESNTVDVISQRSGKVIRHFSVGTLPQHVTPSWDLKRLWVTNDKGNSLTPIDPRTSKPGKPVSVLDPYNMYFTVDGRYAIVVAEAHRQLDFRNAQTMRLHHSLPVPTCAGVDHMDFTADGQTALASCEFAGKVVVVDLAHERVRKTISLSASAMPQDVKLSPDGKTFYVADMASGGVWTVDAQHMRKRGFIATGQGAHGLYPSRDSRSLFVSNRGAGSISVLSFARRRVVKTWHLPGGGSPDMGGVSANGRVLWLSGRYNSEVYAISTRNGKLLHRISVGSGPHGMCVWPQPGRYSIGHTGILR